jgi:hypothetical protein
MRRSFFVSSVVAVCFTTLAYACSSTTTTKVIVHPDGGATDAGSDAGGDAGQDAAPVPPLGQVMPQVKRFTATGPVLTTPKVVAITYDNDTNRSQLETFMSSFAASSSWATETSEYGVGALTVGTPQHIAGNAPTAPADSDAQALLAANLTAQDGGPPLWGAPDPNTIYALFYPSGTIADDGTGAKCCTDFDGYHGQSEITGVNVAYAIMCSCPGFDGPTIADLPQLTVVASHELVEAATDPFPFSNPAFSETDDAHGVWSFVNGGEVADMCALVDTTFWNPPDLSFTIQRAWSNMAAAAGHDPCVGQPTTPYYQTVPYLPDTALVSGVGIKTNAINIAVGQTATLSLHVYADATAGPFLIGVADYSGNGYLSITGPQDRYNPGDEITAQITVNSQDPQLGNAETFIVTTSPSNQKGPSTYYYGFVAQE